MLEVEGLAVRFGGVLPLQDVTLRLDAPVCGVIGPNGAGKTTLLNVLSGFVRPVAGTVSADGTNLLALPSYRRARWGLRRTFQQEQIVDELTLRANVQTAAEHMTSGDEGGLGVEEALEFVGLHGVGHTRAASATGRERRLAEIARALVGQPRIVLCDEPAAGLREDETAALEELLRAIPERLGAQVILVDHDIELVRDVCEWTAVLDFGHLIAAGATAEVLDEPEVKLAYLGVEEKS